MDYGGNMKGSRLKDVLDETPIDKTFWDKVFDKMELLYRAIEKFKGPNMDIDDREYRWVNDRIEYYENDERLLNKAEMIYANSLWDKYGS